MDTEPHSEDLFPDSEVTDKDPSQVAPEPDQITDASPNEEHETPDLFETEKIPEVETFEEPLRLVESVDETPDLLGSISDNVPIDNAYDEENNDAPDIDEEMNYDDDDIPEDDPDIDLETPDLEEDQDVVAEEETPVLKTMELRQADFDSGKNKEPTEKQPHISKLINLPLSRVKNIMKLDPDVRLMSGEAIFVIAKATELFIESLTKECMVHKDPKKKTIQKRDVDQVFASADSLMFLEGAMDF